MSQLPKTLSIRVNRLAHRLAFEHEEHAKASLTERLQKARTDGASLDDLTAMLATLEAAQPG
ncbi:MAG: hypothetical protein R6W97_08070 [Thiobacillus sp.]